MRAKIFDLVLAAKGRDKEKWDKIADTINEKYKTMLTGEQIKEFVQRGKVPFGGWLVAALTEHLNIRDFGPAFLKSFTSSGEDD